MSKDSGLNGFLHRSKGQFSSWCKNSSTRVGVVMGNEASDLDSIVCSTMYAYFLNSKARENEGFIPLLNIPREDLKLRTETYWLFESLGVVVDNLVFLPEVQKEFDGLHESKRLDLVLVDHNRLAVSQEKYEDSVKEIVDHHKEENRCPNAKGSRRIINLVGSCGTLVADRILSENPGLLTKFEATLLLAPILLDTVNLEPKHQKVTKKDEEIAAALFKIAEINEQKQKELFEKLQFERFSVDSLSTRDLLRCDYKQWTMGGIEVGVGAAKKPLKKWLEMDANIAKEFDSFLQSRKLDILFAMTQYMDNHDNMFRELIVFTHDRALYERTHKFLLASDLKLVEIETDKAASLSTKDFVIAFFNQENTAASRKQLQPLLVDNYEKSS